MTGFPEGDPLSLPVKAWPPKATPPGLRALALSASPTTRTDGEGREWAFWKDKAGQWFRYEVKA